MTRQLLVLVLLLELLESETANVTREELRETVRNQTVTSLDRGNTTKKFHNSTWSLNEELREVEVNNNQSSQFVYEEDERFQEKEDHIQSGLCNYDHLYVLSYRFCGVHFFDAMETIQPKDWCVFERTVRPYNDLTLCLEVLSQNINCFFPNPTIQDFFLEVHSDYFSNCSRDEELLEDAPEWLVVVMTLVPVSLIPVLVYLVVWKSTIPE